MENSSHKIQRFEQRFNNFSNNDIEQNDKRNILNNLEYIESVNFNNKYSYGICLGKFDINKNSHFFVDVNGRSYYRLMDDSNHDSTGDEFWVIIRNNKATTFMLRKHVQSLDENYLKEKLRVDYVIFDVKSIKNKLNEQNDNKTTIKNILKEGLLDKLKISVKSKLYESMSFSIIENILDEDYPSSFDMNHFKTIGNFSKRIKYCEEHLKRISSGSSRIVYMIDDTKVLKLAKNNKGLAQNEVEIEWGGDYYFETILAHTFSHSEDNLWVEMELAKKMTKRDFLNITGCNIDDMGFYLRNQSSLNKGGRAIFDIDKEIENALNENEFVQSIHEFMSSVDAPAGDLGRLSSYGIVKRDGVDTVVLIDFGLTNDVYQTYYS